MQTNNGKQGTNGDALGKPRPPSFEEARNRRQKIRSAGLDPNYWYAVLQAPELKKGEVREVFFWKRSIALYRDEQGEAHAIENRCAHRQLRLSAGKVEGLQFGLHLPRLGLRRQRARRGDETRPVWQEHAAGRRRRLPRARALWLDLGLSRVTRSSPKAQRCRRSRSSRAPTAGLACRSSTTSTVTTR
jgi:hypothetical protein